MTSIEPTLFDIFSIYLSGYTLITGVLIFISIFDNTGKLLITLKIGLMLLCAYTLFTGITHILALFVFIVLGTEVILSAEKNIERTPFQNTRNSIMRTMKETAWGMIIVYAIGVNLGAELDILS
ncbi:hypothetical protein GA069_16415 [Vibrio parahaemolyticus]|nr:hypothetical protein [Vibrio parahaemolyticus]EGQ8549119.1 hypothetical protein [Vibrio parahaemolyticus]EGQ9131424.1 hypothetical protein [Vibrio parahaemolyticus]ELA6925049.1 hypothetical protein [Vibrio parahaemolyticus]